ncbi:hypothetical protein [Sinorhizobium fredii]|uniref:hypothetical protein n=1 Tax=Rhizobium fredii TaxID=380 RepID=UPI0018E96F05|nr:hypothetical protein [Sinorhizobium fredii]
MHSDDRETAFGYDDHHLLFRLIVDIDEGLADGQIVGMSTLVRRGRLYGLALSCRCDSLY